MSRVRYKTSDCRACELGSLGLPRCFGDGPTLAEVAVVGINPSIRAKDGVAGAFNAPFYGRIQATGRLSAIKKVGADRAFVAIADGAGLDIARIYSTNTVKCATPGNRAPKPEEVRTCVGKYLRRELEALPILRAVLVFGRVSGDALGLSEFGQTRTVEGTIATACLFRHPIATLRRWTRLNRETTKLREFLKRFAPSSTRAASALAPP